MDQLQLAGWMWWTVAGIQIFGLFCGTLVRASWSRTPQLVCQLLFFLSFTTVALATVGCLAIGSHGWVFSGLTLGVMAISATWDAGLQRTETAL